MVGGFLTFAYPFVKRWVSIPQFILGAAFGWAVPMAFAAQTGTTPELAWLLFGTALTWAQDLRDTAAEFDLVVVGAGHAGCEAALTAARLEGSIGGGDGRLVRAPPRGAGRHGPGIAHPGIACLIHRGWPKCVAGAAG